MEQLQQIAKIAFASEIERAKDKFNIVEELNKNGTITTSSTRARSYS